jgi:leader peptidase (prepilin peptidase)/N-methyltransferase
VEFTNLLTYGWAGLFLFIWVSASFGSFLNVVIYRLPVMIERQFEVEARHILNLTGNLVPHPRFNLMTPGSRCPRCGHGIRAWENIPIFGWLALRGRCSQCRTPISARYPIVELFTCVISLLVIASFGFTWLGLAALGFTWCLIALTGIDFDVQLLPDQITLPLLWAGLLVNYFDGFVDIGDALFGAVIGYLSLWLVYWAFKLITGREGMGYGDFKLLAAIGAWFGWQVLPSVILISAVTGLVYAVYGMIASGQRESVPIAFGPFLAVGGFVALLYPNLISSLY